MHDNTLNRESIEYRALDSFDNPVKYQEIVDRLIESGLAKNEAADKWSQLQFDFWLVLRDGLWFKHWQAEGAPSWDKPAGMHCQLCNSTSSNDSENQDVIYCTICGRNIAVNPIANDAVKNGVNQAEKKAKYPGAYKKIIDAINKHADGQMFYGEMVKLLGSHLPDYPASLIGNCLNGICRNKKYRQLLQLGTATGTDGKTHKTWGPIPKQTTQELGDIK